MFSNLIQNYKHWHTKNSDISLLPPLFLSIAILMTISTGGRFLQGGNILNLAIQIPELGILSMAMMIAMITAGINLAIISSANLSAVIMALFITRLMPENASQTLIILMVIATILLGLFVSALLGFINGFLIGYLEVPAVLTTLGTMILYEGITLAITRGFVISGLPEAFLSIGNSRILGIPIPLCIMVIVAIFLGVLLKRRPFGTQLYFIGSNAVATKYSGIDIRKVLVRAYVLSTLLTGFAAIIMLARFNSANARQGSSLLLQTVLICMLGGVDPNGGFGKIPGLLMALLILQMVTSGLNLLGIRSFATVAIWGILLIGAITYRYWQHKRQISASKTQVHKLYSSPE